jgi:hypothetical protein
MNCPSAGALFVGKKELESYSRRNPVIYSNFLFWKKEISPIFMTKKLIGSDGI